MKSSTLIPKDFLPILPPKEENQGKDPRRVTLLHKKGDSLVCLLSRGMETVSYNKPIEDALVLQMFGKECTLIFYEPEIKLNQRSVGNSSYMIVSSKGALNEKEKKKKIPFLREGELVSDFIENGEGFDKKVDNLIELINENFVAHCESFADVGFFRGFYTKKVKEAKEKYKEAGMALYPQVQGLFHEEKEGISVRKHDFKVSDRSLDNYFNDPRSISRRIKVNSMIYGLLLPMLSLMPACLPDYLESNLREKYEKRFKQIDDEGEKKAIALSEFALCNPKLMSGIRRAYFELKAISNLGVYGVQLAANTYAITNFSPWVSIPLSIPTAITGTTMLRNAIRSGGQDYSGVIPTVINRFVINHIKEKTEN